MKGIIRSLFAPNKEDSDSASMATASPSPTPTEHMMSRDNGSRGEEENGVEADGKHDKPSTALHLHTYEVGHKGVQTFLRVFAKSPNLLQECFDAVKGQLYDDTLQTSQWKQNLPRSITVIIRDMDGVAYTTGKVLDDDHKEVHFNANYIQGLKKRRKRSAASKSDTTATSTVAAPTPTPTSKANAAVEDNAGSESSHDATYVKVEKEQDDTNDTDGCQDGIFFTHADIEAEIRGVLIHEFVHCMQYNGRGTCPGGLIEGIADWVRLRTGFAAPHWKPYHGRKDDEQEEKEWDCGYDTTAYFLKWLEKRLDVSHLVPRLNQSLSSHKWHQGEAMNRACHKKVNLQELWHEYCQR